MAPDEASGKVVAVTGAGGAVGAAVVDELAAAGWTVVGIDRAMIKDEARLGLKLEGFDLADPVAAHNVFKEISDTFGRLDALVNVAGAFRWETFRDGSTDTWDFLYTVNLKTALNATRGALELLSRQGGSIVNIGAAASGKASKGMGAYAASKAAISRFTESLADELLDENVTVNAILPSIVDTPQNRSDMGDDGAERWVSPRALAQVIEFLISDRARAITGSLVTVAGRVRA